MLADAVRIDIASLWDAHITPLRDGWSLTVESEVHQTDLGLPVCLTDPDITDKILTLTRPLPVGLQRMHSMLFRTSQKTVRVFIDGKLIYTYDASLEDRQVKIAGLVNHFIWIPAASEGKLLQIELENHDPASAGTLHEVYVGSRTSTIWQLLRYDGISIVLAFIIILLGLLALFVVTIVIRDLAIRSITMQFGLLELCAGIWVACGSMSTQLIVHNQVVLLVVGMAAMHLLPYFLTRYVVETIHIPASQVMTWSSLAFPVIFITVSLLQFISPVTYFDILIPVAVLLFIDLVVLSGLVVVAGRQGNKDARLFIIASGFLLTSVLGELILMFIPYETFTNALVLNVGILGFSVMLLVQLLGICIRYIRSLGKNDYMYMLAHTDSLTAVGNRLAFDQALASLMEAQAASSTVALFLFDVNNLKLTNDSFGHAVGDELLRASAAGLSECVGAKGRVFRIGGDEFAVIVSPCDPQEYRLLDEGFDAWIHTHRTVDGMSRLAKGSAFCDCTRQSIDEVFKAADAAMYRHKDQQKTLFTQERI
jgi:diguanylate cyclase (GGDEF)-like protein